MRKLTTSEFLIRAKGVHGSKYDTSKAIYTGVHNKLIIKCFKHGDWQITPANFLKGKGCPRCYGNNKKNNNEFIYKAREVHGEQYDYSLTEYKGAKSIITIKCSIHGFFTQESSSHLQGCGCPNCGYEKASIKLASTVNSKRETVLEQPKDYKLIRLLTGELVKVDNEDFKYLKDINWSITSEGYAINALKGRMHRYITNCPKDMVVDHINHDILDNRRDNLRICTITQNNWNSRPRKNKVSKYVGVDWCKSVNKWRSRLRVNGEEILIGYYDNEKEASIHRDLCALKERGEYAYLNLPNLIL